MKYVIASLVFMLSTALFAAGAEDSHGPELRLVATKTTQLVGETPDVQLFLLNNSTAPIYVDQGFLRTSIEMKIDDDWVNCGQMTRGTPGVRTEAQWNRIDPDAELLIGIGSYWCPEDAGPVSQGRDWTENSGTYQLQVEVSHRIPADALSRIGPAPDGARVWTLRSNIVEVSVDDPVGIDEQAFRWAQEHGHSPLSVEVANNFPSSRYGALVVWQSLTIHDGSPEHIKDFVEKGFYPGRSSVPDASSPNGRRSVSAGEDMARWRIEQGERLLREQENFPYEQDVRLSVAVSYAAVGEKDKATELLQELKSEEGSRESRWAEHFLTLQGWQ